jgi:hypothetical protein
LLAAKGVAYAILAKLFDHSVGLGDLSPNASSSMYLFDRSGTPLVSLWSLDRTNRSLMLNLSASSYKVYDLMGNPISISNGTIPYGGTPVYIEGIGISVATLRSAVQGGTVAVELDTTPPNLSLVVHPTGPTQENPVKFRWLAIDETSTTSFGPPKETSSPSDGDPQAIQYSYYLQGYDTNWSPWSVVTFVDYYQIPAGSYDFQLKVRDAAGNISSTNHFALVVGEPLPKPLTLRPLLVDGFFRIHVSGGTNQGFIVVESSSDFFHWTPLHTNSATGGTFEFSDPTNGSPSPRFYRVREQP